MNINKLYCGDNLEIMKTFPDDSINLIYADPPFFTQKDWGDFDDHFDNMDYYLQWLRPRLERCRDVLKDTGSIYCHLDWHAAHYVKVIMDEIFGMKNFQNEIAWHYISGGAPKAHFKRKHDSILFYTKTNIHTFNIIKERKPKYKNVDERKFLEDEKGKFVWYIRPNTNKNVPKGVKSYIDSMLDDVWDIPIINPQAKERLGYPTQKPEALLERIIKASSNPGDVVLDCFCGCGTAVAVAQKLGRKWIGIDENVKAIELSHKRLYGGLNGYK